MSPGLVVVIIGATSGVGRATALAFARQQAYLVLAARNEAALCEVIEQCHHLGTQALSVSMDMRDAAAVDGVREVAVEIFGRIDVWVNCAAVLLLGRFEDLPHEAFRQVIETNLLGYANGARTAIAQFHRQGSRGTLINVSSVLSLVGEPLASAYVASKFAIRGLTACLRQEMRRFPDIHISSVMPAALDTPMYQHAGNFLGREARSIAPTYDPRKVAKAILRLLTRPRPDVVVTGFGHLIAVSARFAPRVLERLVGAVAPRLQFRLC